ncbi:ArdC-like ssDNA-binding domain-containing protein [uncultured Kocuria sp.]|uniref:ArdC-like ssDNA-binding domain-containing protein n=1 Tax=uncultured Kocuria sp. TaxID=259305 RepID=UPI00260EFB36|nr:ArdC-like ssDNA-binding domain-containing protein [uncultured Kocuria sp.]
MERKQYRKSPERKEQQPARLDWEQLLEEALDMPGNLGNTYNRFYNYSFLNQLLLYQQGVREPVNTYDRWKAMNRQVQKGSKAKAILRPISRKVENDNGEEEVRLTGFKMVNCLFTASETEGDPLPEYEPKLWSPERALGALAIREVAYGLVDGNTQGYSSGHELAINPVAAYPVKTMVHEMGHIVAGHTVQEKMAEYLMHRGLFEFEAEGSAYLVMNEIDEEERHFDSAESRAYIQGWLQGETPPEESIRRVFTTADKILKAGREES